MEKDRRERQMRQGKGKGEKGIEGKNICVREGIGREREVGDG